MCIGEPVCVTQGEASAGLGVESRFIGALRLSCTALEFSPGVRFEER